MPQIARHSRTLRFHGVGVTHLIGLLVAVGALWWASADWTSCARDQVTATAGSAREGLSTHGLDVLMSRGSERNWLSAAGDSAPDQSELCDDSDDDEESTTPAPSGPACRLRPFLARKPGLERSDTLMCRALFLALHRFRC